MKIKNNIIKQSLVLCLLTIYSVVTVFYICFLPSYNSLPKETTPIAYHVHIRKEMNESGSSLQFHRIFKTIIAGKTQALIAIEVFVVFLLFILSRLTRYNLSSREKQYTQLPRDFYPADLSNLCSLKI